VALAAAGQGKASEAVTYWEQAAAVAARVGNMALQPLVLMNLGVANQRLGNVERAVDYSRRSAAGFQALGQQQRAAEIHANTAQIVIDYGGDVDAALRDVEDALAVFRRYKDNDFEVFCLRLRAAAYRNAGRYAAAEQEIAQAAAIAGQHDLHDKTARLLIDQATLKFEVGDYAAARDLLEKAAAGGGEENAPEVSILAGRIAVRAGDLPAARRHLQVAAELVETNGSPALVPSLYLALGEIDYRAGARVSARAHFDRAMRSANSQSPDEAAVAAGAYLGLLDATSGKPDAGRRIIMTSLEHAKRMQRYALELRCRAYLARSYLAQRRIGEAANELKQIPAAGPETTIGPELRAEIDSIRAEAGMR
jgi:tetratricopeptide (TPR) repeat protein